MIGFLEEATLQMDLKQGSDMVFSTGEQHGIRWLFSDFLLGRIRALLIDSGKLLKIFIVIKDLSIIPVIQCKISFEFQPF